MNAARAFCVAAAVEVLGGGCANLKSTRRVKPVASTMSPIVPAPYIRATVGNTTSGPGQHPAGCPWQRRTASCGAAGTGTGPRTLREQRANGQRLRRLNAAASPARSQGLPLLRRRGRGSWSTEGSLIDVPCGDRAANLFLALVHTRLPSQLPGRRVHRDPQRPGSTTGQDRRNHTHHRKASTCRRLRRAMTRARALAPARVHRLQRRPRPSTATATTFRSA